MCGALPPFVQITNTGPPRPHTLPPCPLALPQLSKIGETWPGAGRGGLEGGAPRPGPDRILLISGSLDSLLTALHAVLTAFRAAPSALAAVSGREDGTMCLRLLVHARLCGTLIGRGGATICSFKEASGAVFNISPAPGPGEPPERVVRVTGQPDELLKAVALVLTKLSQNPDYAALTDTHVGFAPPQDPRAAFGGAAPGVPGAAAGVAGGGVAPDRGGMVLGRAGSVVNQLKAVLGVRIHISPRGDYLPGTLLRRCEIIGPPENVTLARHVIEQKVKGGQE